MNKIWIGLVFIRFVLVIIGQNGYIHPDEFFQGIEIISGDIFNCTNLIYRTWEFQFTKNIDNINGIEYIQEPIRNMAIPYFFYGITLYLLKRLSQLGATTDYLADFKIPDHFSNGLNLVHSKNLILFPRIFMSLFSFFNDLILISVIIN